MNPEERILLLAPVAAKGSPRVHFYPGEYEDRPVTGDMRRWRVTRTASWTTKEDFAGVAAVAGLIGGFQETVSRYIRPVKVERWTSATR